ncbi:MAG: metal-dependent hydrolase [Candidatus Acidiferrales bacterium]|nr:metal-dependent hydrolase [Candidatus Acidoferrales bacterium]
MNPITQALMAVALDRAGLRRVSRMALPILVVSGVAADLDLLSYFGGANAYLHYRYAVLHSIVGAPILAIVIALAFWLASRRSQAAPLRFSRVLLLCVIGIGAHILLDVATADGVQLLWPFRARWFSWDLLSGVDPWILAVLTAGLLLPALFHLVSEEIGSKKKRARPSKGAIAVLVIVVVYIGVRAEMHDTAVQMLLAPDYHGAMPLAAGAFPDSASLFLWRGVLDTKNTIEVVSVPIGSSDVFDANSSLTHYKPGSSPAIDAARSAPLAQEFVRYARFPLADLENTAEGYRVTLRDMRFPDDADTPDNLIAVIELNANFTLRAQEIQFASGQQSRSR